MHRCRLHKRAIDQRPTPIDEIPELTDREIAIYTMWWDCGMHPPTRRVWRDGVDVTYDSPASPSAPPAAPAAELTRRAATRLRRMRPL